MIPLGFELGSGKRVSIPLGHMIVLGQTQKSGKTTTLEALTDRSGVCAIAFITKRGEKSFRLAHTIPPFYSETSETQPYWKFVISLIESMQDINLGMRERGYVMDLCRKSSIEKTVTDSKGKKAKEKHSWKEPKTLAEVLENAAVALEHSKGVNRMICLQLWEYLRIAVPEIQRAKLSNTIELRRGINVMDISKLSTDVQALIVRSVVEWVYLKRKNTVVIIPEAWKFLPEQHATPVLAPVMSLIRQGAVIGNFVWIDLQDLRGIKKEILRSIQVWLFGVQREKNEIENTLKSMPVPEAKPTAADMMSLRIGQFIVAHDDEIRRVYVQPAGMEDAHAQAIARGEERPESWPQILRSLETVAAPVGVERADRADRADHSAVGESDETVETAVKAAPVGGELRASVPGMEGTNGDEEMWKEKYEQFRADVEQILSGEELPGFEGKDSLIGFVADLRVSHDALAARLKKLEEKGSPSRTSTQRSAETAGAAANGKETPVAAAPVNGDAPPLLLVNTEVPQLRVGIDKPEISILLKRKTIEMDGSSVVGTIAILISEGFFDQTITAQKVISELRRRGLSFKDGTARDRCADIAQMGFLTKEGKEGYRAVPQMKVNVTEVPA